MTKKLSNIAVKGEKSKKCKSVEKSKKVKPLVSTIAPTSHSQLVASTSHSALVAPTSHSALVAPTSHSALVVAPTSLTASTTPAMFNYTKQTKEEWKETERDIFKRAGICPHDPISKYYGILNVILDEHVSQMYFEYVRQLLYREHISVPKNT